MQEISMGDRSKDRHSQEYIEKRRAAHKKRRAAPGYIKPKHVPAIKAAIIKRDGWLCHYCGKPMRWKNGEKGRPEPRGLATIEHLVPVSEGGSRELDNLVLAHKACNQEQEHKRRHRCRPDHPHPCPACPHAKEASS